MLHWPIREQIHLPDAQASLYMLLSDAHKDLHTTHGYQQKRKYLLHGPRDETLQAKRAYGQL